MIMTRISDFTAVDQQQLTLEDLGVEPKVEMHLTAEAICGRCGHNRRCPYAWADGNRQTTCPKLRKRLLEGE